MVFGSPPIDFSHFHGHQWKWSLNNRIRRGTYKASMVNGQLNRPSWEPILQVVPLAFHSSCIRGFSLRPRPRNKRLPLWWLIIRRWGVLAESFGLMFFGCEIFFCICQILGLIIYCTVIAVILVSLYHNKVGFVGVFFGRAIAVCTIVFFMKCITPEHPQKTIRIDALLL